MNLHSKSGETLSHEEVISGGQDAEGVHPMGQQDRYNVANRMGE